MNNKEKVKATGLACLFLTIFFGYSTYTLISSQIVWLMGAVTIFFGGLSALCFIKPDTWGEAIIQFLSSRGSDATTSASQKVSQRQDHSDGNQTVIQNADKVEIHPREKDKKTLGPNQKTFGCEKCGCEFTVSPPDDAHRDCARNKSDLLPDNVIIMNKKCPDCGNQITLYWGSFPPALSFG